ncbi:unnamed protein product [Porites evermanni]|uniref:Tr-type G domain-containing protein n=1 Tax=Porites evermanni TaxID=104178 RepID=A0ABN8LUQ3_9CNID|nr:unnamed protein product [Porites evermanni]
MARHRNYRNYSYEDDLSDDVYGHSVEDYDLAVSPTTAEQFMFRRSNSRDPNLSSYMADRFGRVDEEDEEESEEETLASSQDYKRPQLDPTSEAKLSSCMDQLHSILGETLHEPTAVTAVLQSNFDLERALDQILSQGGKQDLKANLDPDESEGSVSCKTDTLIKDIHVKRNKHKTYNTEESCSNHTVGITERKAAVFMSDSQLSKSAVTESYVNVSSELSLSALARDESLSQPVGILSCQTVTSLPLDQIKASSQKSLMTAPLSSLSQSGGALSGQPQSQSKALSQNPVLSASLSSLTKSERTPPSQAQDRVLTPSQYSLLSAPLSSFSQPGGSLSGQTTTSQPLDLLQTSSQNSLLSAPLSSLSQPGGSLSTQASTSQPLGLSRASPQSSLLSVPLNTFRAGRKEVKLLHPVQNHVSLDAKKAEAAPVVTSVQDKPVIGFSTPPVNNKKSRESSPENETETDQRQANKKQMEKDQLLAEAHKEYHKRRKGKTLLNLVVIGHVDAGKSTLMGHLLYRLGDVSKKAMHKYETESKKAGKASFAYAWVLDETGEERERGITMDVGLTRFETETKLITLMDAPGHKDFIPNMITGASQADVAILVVGSSTGEFESGFEAGGQTREHALLVRSLGVTQLIVAVNKLDNVGWSEARYNHVVGKLKHFLKQAGFKDSDVVYVPCSGLTGENLTKCCNETLLRNWYNGPTLLDRIDNFKPPKRELEKPFRFWVSDVYKGMGAGINVTGKLEAGKLQNGDKVVVMPAGEQGLVKALSIHDEPVQLACAGDHVTLTLSGLDMMHVGVGSVLCPPSSPIKCTMKLKARILVFNIRVPITKGFMVLFHYKTLNEPATIHRLCSVLHKSTGEVLQKKPRCLTKNSNAEVVIHTFKPVCVELYKDYKDLGRFMLRYGGETIAAGVVTEIL